VKQLPWVAWVYQHSPESPLRAEQAGEIERLVRELSDRSSLRAVLDRVLDALVRWTGVERGLLLLPAPNGKLVVRAARNLAAQDLSPEQRELSQTLAKQALESGECVVAMDASGELSSLHQSVHALRLRSVLAVPLTARGETQGVVYLDDRVRRGAFGPPELAWVKVVSTIAAVALSEARDVARLRRAAKRAQRAERQLTEHLSRKESELSHAKLALDNASLPGVTHGMVGRTKAMQALFSLIARVAPADIPVFVSGESGTGKELVARALHQQSLRHGGAFVSENCSAIPANLVESILFGHKKGSFTGATHNHTGLFELADGGTLFLDELGEMSLAMQAKLLRVLETGELRRVGGERNIQVSVRLVGASHRNLEQMVEQGSFREDLYYRLNVITLALPPLRERTSDIPELVAHFMSKYGRTGIVDISPRALAALQTHAWPGNVRQLENEIRRAMVLTDGCIDLEHLSPSVAGGQVSQPNQSSSLNMRAQVDALETRLIERALKEALGNQSRAAETLGVSRFGLQKMLKRLGLSAPK
jgi:serine/threonine-protein kinase PknK